MADLKVNKTYAYKEDFGELLDTIKKKLSSLGFRITGEMDAKDKKTMHAGKGDAWIIHLIGELILPEKTVSIKLEVRINKKDKKVGIKVVSVDGKRISLKKFYDKILNDAINSFEDIF